MFSEHFELVLSQNCRISHCIWGGVLQLPVGKSWFFKKKGR